jgi:hypothetical protein
MVGRRFSELRRCDAGESDKEKEVRIWLNPSNGKLRIGDAPYVWGKKFLHGIVAMVFLWKLMRNSKKCGFGRRILACLYFLLTTAPTAGRR